MPASDAPVGPDGYTIGNYCGLVGSYLSGAIFADDRLSIAQCEANLSFSRCGATLYELDDCILTTMGEGPHPLGCGRYLDTDGCSETIINKVIPVTSTPEAGTVSEAGIRSPCSVRVR